jgi:hypothetical protein
MMGGMAVRGDRSAFPLRLDERTQRALRLVADHLGVSMNTLAGDMIARELEALVATLDDQVSETLQALRSYRGEGHDEDWAAFARAEVEQKDPVRTRLARPAPADRYGVAEIFG